MQHIFCPCKISCWNSLRVNKALDHNALIYTYGHRCQFSIDKAPLSKRWPSSVKGETLEAFLFFLCDEFENMQNEITKDENSKSISIRPSLPLLPSAYVVRREGTVFAGVCLFITGLGGGGIPSLSHKTSTGPRCLIGVGGGGGQVLFETKDSNPISVTSQKVARTCAGVTWLWVNCGGSRYPLPSLARHVP